VRMKNSSFGWLALSALTFSPAAMAQIPTASITQATLNIYGIYTTSDPLCKADLIDTMPLQKTATGFNLAAKPKIGSGLAANPIKCVIFVMEAKASIGWAAGSYSTTTGGNSDSVCNAGGSTTLSICGPGTTPTFPETITNDAKEVGLSLSSACTGGGTEVVPLYLSVNARCSGNSTTDDSSCNSAPGYDVYNPPTGESALKGLKITTPTGSTGNMAFDVDVSRVVGNNAGQCGSPAAPTFAFTDAN
jgi:hypothetical protein